MTTKMKRLAVLCSGGDSPGMNASIRAIVRTGIYNKIEIVGIKRGYAGLINEEFVPMELSSVGNILQRGGTILQTSRCPEFHQKETRKKANDILQKNKIDGLIIIGGDGSFNGAHLLQQEQGTSLIGIPGTIDNDITGSEYTIGFDTAVRNAIEAVDRIRETASSHARTFLIEVMGRNSSAIAQQVGICCGAENILIPHEEVNYKEIVDDINRGVARGKTSSIIIVAEGEYSGRSYDIQKKLKSSYSLPAHVCILGHIQRGGSPTAQDRLIASQMGHMAVKGLLEGTNSKVTVVQNGIVQLAALQDCLVKNNNTDAYYKELAKTLSI